MSRLIDADKLLERGISIGWQDPKWVSDIVIKDAPTIDAVEVVRCKDCIYYDAEHIENDGVRYEYEDMPKEAFDKLGTGLVTASYGINVGGMCYRDWNEGYIEDKRVYVPESNYCGRGERRDDE